MSMQWVNQVTQSPMNPQRWLLSLGCGHEVYVTSKTKPRRKREACPKCHNAVQAQAEEAEPVYTFHITPSTPEARERIADGAEKPELLRGTLAQGRNLARLLNSSIDLLFGTGHTAFHINPDGRMPCEIEEALDRCADEAEDAESFDDEDCDDETDEEDEP